MVKKTLIASNDEPEQVRFEIPSEGEHQFQVVDLWTDKNDENIILVKLEVSEGDELGRSILHRVNLDNNWKGFFFTRMFLKAINEPHKGEFEVDTDMWVGRVFYATIIHNIANNGKTYANIDQFNFDKVVEQVNLKVDEERQKAIDSNEIAWDS
jgi:hypothetical protein